jgi:hypothetical protein
MATTVVRVDDMTGAGPATLGGFSQPRCIFVDVKEDHISMKSTTGLQVDDMTGANQVTTAINTTDTFSNRWHLCGHQWKIYVADGGHSRIVRVDNMTGRYGSTDTLTLRLFIGITGIFVNTDGKIYVSDSTATALCGLIT